MQRLGRRRPPDRAPPQGTTSGRPWPAKAGRGAADMAPEQLAAMRGGLRQEGRGRRPGNAAAAGDRAMVWVFDQGSLGRIPVRTGISDGTQTAVLGGELAPGTQVVTGVLTGAAAVASPTGSPLLPFGRRGGGGRGGGAR